MNNTILWQSVLSSLENKVSKPTFVTWFSNTYIKKREEEIVTISVPNIFVREWLQNKFEKSLISSLKKFSPEINKIKYTITSNSKSSSSSSSLSSSKKTNNKNQFQSSFDISQPKIEFYQNRISGLNPKYNFENFLISDFNQLASACAVSITRKIKSSSSSLDYNPFFVYGKSGLGKTHLLEAIGNEIIKGKKGKKIKYIPCPNFTSEIVSSIRNQSIEKTINNYKKFNILIIDDIEFIAGKERTQEVFFRIFNDLTENGSQIILSSDRPPRVIENIEERLRSRFEGGMVADISLPAFEERLAILEKKAEEKESLLPKEILEFIAKNIKKNIREIEGALIKAIILFEKERSFEGVKKQLKDIIEEPQKKISPEKVIKMVCDFYNLSKKEILSKNRKKEIVLPRQVIMYFLREDIKLSLPSIGAKIGNRDHTTVSYSCEKIEEKLKKDADFIKDIEVIKENIFSN